MTVVRAIAAVLVGYLLYALGSMTLVGAVLGNPGVATMIAALVGLTLIGLVVGFVVRAIAGTKAAIAATVTAALVVLVTIANLALALGAEPLWYKLGTIFLTVPGILVIGRRMRQVPLRP